MKKIASLLGVILGVGACASAPDYNNALQSWQGQPVEYLYEQWGNPNSTSQLSDGSMIMTYNIQSFQDVPPQVNLEQEISGNAPSFAGSPFFSTEVTYFCTTTFTITKGIITNYSYEGDNCQ